MKKQRRDFVKITTVGAAGLVLGRAGRLFAGWPASGTLAINPDISNMRVVSCCDTSMVADTKQMTFAAQNSATNGTRVAANLDAMAMQLANADTADAAWKKIFRSSKPWDSTVVAIKINTVEVKNMPRIAILQKLTAVLVGFGVSPSNIILYDAGGGSGGMVSVNTSPYESYCSLTDKDKVQGKIGSLGNKTSAPIGGGGSGNCLADLANGKVDILINLAVNKGHMLADATLCMKNHFGTFDAVPGHNDIVNYLVNINKSDAIVGGSPARQQLCIVDSLFAMRSGPTGTPDKMPCYLVMGVFAPAVDYLTVKKIREGALGYTHTASNIGPLLTKFGYGTSDAEWVEVPPASDTQDPGGGAGGAGGGGTGGKAGTGGNANAGSGGRTNAGTGGASTPGSGGHSGTSSTDPKGSGGKGTDQQGAAGAAGSQKSPAGKAGDSGQGGNDRAPAGTAGTSNGQGGASSPSSQVGEVGGASEKAGSKNDETDSGSNGPASSGCHVPVRSSGPTELGVAAIVGTVVAGQLRRLFVRRDTLGRGSAQERPAAPARSDATDTEWHSDDSPPKRRD